MRVFIAAELPDTLRGALADKAKRASAIIAGRYLDPVTYHVTLAFIGDVEEREITRIEQALKDACAGCAPIELTPAEAGFFGRRARGRMVLWQGFALSAELEALAVRVRSCLHEAGISFDDKPFSPHVTLARRATVDAGRLRELDGAGAPAGDEVAGGAIERVTLFESKLTTAGAAYRPLATAALGAAPARTDERDGNGVAEAGV